MFLVEPRQGHFWALETVLRIVSSSATTAAQERARGAGLIASARMMTKRTATEASNVGTFH
jgi:hypothetical protein